MTWKKEGGMLFDVDKSWEELQNDSYWAKLRQQESFGVMVKDIPTAQVTVPAFRNSREYMGEPFDTPGEMVEVIVGYDDSGKPIVQYMPADKTRMSILELKRLQEEVKEKTLRAQRKSQEEIIKVSANTLFEAIVEGMSNKLEEKRQNPPGIRWAYYMTKNEKDTAQLDFVKRLGIFWSNVLLKEAHKQAPEDIQVGNSPFMVTLFDQDTILIYKYPIPDVPKKEPVKLWTENDFVESGLNWTK